MTPPDGGSVAAGAVELRAGDVTALLENGDLRVVRRGGATLARRIYVAVRDTEWATVPGVISDLRVRSGHDNFDVTYTCTHRCGDIDFVWGAQFTGSADGTIECRMDGIAGAPFQYGRIGFCVLHAPEATAGAAYRTSGGETEAVGTLPSEVTAPKVEGGSYRSLMPAFTKLEIDQADGERVSLAFTGDLFELEDERSWTDASLKTYCTPYAAGFRTVARSERLQQSVRLRSRSLPSVAGAGPRGSRAVPRSERGVEIAIDGSAAWRLPNIGLSLARDGQELSPAETAVLRLVRPGHLRVELRMHEGGWPDELARANREAASFACGLEAVLFLTDDARNQMASLAPMLRAVGLARVIVLHEPLAQLSATDPRWVALARELLGPVIGEAVPVGGGTYGNFAELAGGPLATGGMDFVSFTANPQVHATDDRSILENAAGLGPVVASAARLAGGKPVVVSPLTLAQPFNPYAATPGGYAPRAGGAAADPRQSQLIGAVWVLRSTASLAEGGTAGVSIGETAGDCGLMPRSAIPGGAPAESAGAVYPIFHVLADLAACQSATVRPCRSVGGMGVAALVLQQEDRLTLMAANLEATETRLIIPSLPAGIRRLRVLDDTTLPQACAAPAAFRSEAAMTMLDPAVEALDLAPYAIATIQVELSAPRPRAEEDA
jgi:hypothetical protein